MEPVTRNKKVLAFDFGASSGRAMLGIFDGKKIEMKEIHRFANEPVTVNGTVYWDVLRLFFEIKESLIKAKAFGALSSIGIDTWGVDFGLLDKDGQLLSNPVHYRDQRTVGMVEKSFEKISQSDFYQLTGNQFMELNTVFQLLALKERESTMLKNAETLLLMPDLLNYFLTGKKVTERSIASTTQMYDPRAKVWSELIFDTFDLPKALFTEIVPAGTVIGPLLSQIKEELCLESCEVVAVASHDTQSALVAVPTTESDFIFLSCGTWSLLGTEIDEPLINEKTMGLNLTNEAGFGDKTSLLKNITGLWLLQESRRQWLREGEKFSFSELVALAEKEAPFQCFIDPDDALFVTPGNLPQRIKDYCSKTGQKIPQTIGGIVRCIIESLALKYRYALDGIESCTDKKYQTLYMVGGGINNRLLCQMTANATGCLVSSGPVEATVLGNMAVQLIATGDIRDLGEARKIIKNSQELELFQPAQMEQWQSAYDRFMEVIS